MKRVFNHDTYSNSLIQTFDKKIRSFFFIPYFGFNRSPNEADGIDYRIGSMVNYGTVQHHSISVSSTQVSGQSRLGSAQVARRFGTIRIQFQLPRRWLSHLYHKILKLGYLYCEEKDNRQTFILTENLGHFSTEGVTAPFSNKSLKSNNAMR